MNKKKTIVVMIEYVEKDLKITITDSNQENLQEVWINK